MDEGGERWNTVARYYDFSNVRQSDQHESRWGAPLTSFVWLLNTKAVATRERKVMKMAKAGKSILQTTSISIRRSPPEEKTRTNPSPLAASSSP